MDEKSWTHLRQNHCKVFNETMANQNLNHIMFKPTTSENNQLPSKKMAQDEHRAAPRHSLEPPVGGQDPSRIDREWITSWLEIVAFPPYPGCFKLHLSGTHPYPKTYNS